MKRELEDCTGTKGAGFIGYSTVSDTAARKDNYFQIDEMPTLGSGKLDMKQLKIMAKELAQTKISMLQRVIPKQRNE